VGEIVAPHGIRGEVRLLPTTDFPERFTPGQKVCLSSSAQQLTIDEVRPYRSFLLLRFAEITERSGAEKLRGALVQVPVSEAMPLAKGEYYRFQLLGLLVVTAEDETLGRVRDILETGANDVLVVEPADPDRMQPILIPATREVLIAVRPAEGWLQVKLLPGLLEV
jgi:16S rRNA processing protein RimM